MTTETTQAGSLFLPSAWWAATRSVLALPAMKRKRLRTHRRHRVGACAGGQSLSAAAHDDRGEINEFNSKCAVPIPHEAGETAREFLGTRHHWKNGGKEPADLTIADLVDDRKPDTMKERSCKAGAATATNAASTIHHRKPS